MSSDLPEAGPEPQAPDMPEPRQERVEFPAPKGFSVPEGADPESGEFDVVCTFAVRPGGILCLKKLGDTEMPGYDDQDGKTTAQHRPSYGNVAQGIQSGMGEAMGGE